MSLLFIPSVERFFKYWECDIIGTAWGDIDWLSGFDSVVLIRAVDQRERYQDRMVLTIKLSVPGIAELQRSGDHIDLWNMDEITSSGMFIRSLLEFIGRVSDLNKSREIWFWEIN